MMTIDEDSERLGLSGQEVLDLRGDHPWTSSWAARYGAGTLHLIEWLAARRPRADRDELCVDGDPAVVARVRAVVAALPEAVAWYLVNNVVIGCSGETPSWTGWMPRLPCARPVWLHLHGPSLELIAHEFGHAWHRTPSGPHYSARERHAAAAELLAEVDVDDAERALFKNEHAADAFATVLGFPICTTDPIIGRWRKARLREDIAQAREQLAKEPDHGSR